jgi:hypothetical protein
MGPDSTPCFSLSCEELKMCDAIKIDDVVEVRLIEKLCFVDAMPIPAGRVFKALVLSVEPLEYFTWHKNEELFLSSDEAEFVRMSERL